MSGSAARPSGGESSADPTPGLKPVVGHEEPKDQLELLVRFALVASPIRFTGSDEIKHVVPGQHIGPAPQGSPALEGGRANAIGVAALVDLRCRCEEFRFAADIKGHEVVTHEIVEDRNDNAKAQSLQQGVLFHSTILDSRKAEGDRF